MKKLLGLILCLAFVLNMATTSFITNKFHENTYYSDINMEKDYDNL